MLIRMVEVVETRETDTPLAGGTYVKTKLRSPRSDGRRVYIEIDQPIGQCVEFEALEEMVCVLIPAKSLLAHVAQVLADE